MTEPNASPSSSSGAAAAAPAAASAPAAESSGSRSAAAASSSAAEVGAAASAPAAASSGSTARPAKADLEVSTVSTTASSDDEHGSAAAAKQAETNFKFSKDAAEFVPTQSGSSAAFNWNLGAREFQPIIPIPQTNSPMGGKGFAGSEGDAAGQAAGSAVQGGAASGQTGMTLMQPMPVVAAQGMGVYPVMAVSMPGGARPRTVAYMSPVSGSVSSVAVGYPMAIGSGGYKDQQSGGSGGDGRGKGGGGGKGAYRRQDGPQRGAGFGGVGGKGADRRQGAGEVGERRGKGAGRSPMGAMVPPRVEEIQEEPPESEEEEEAEAEKKDPSKKSWADIARESMKASAASPVADAAGAAAGRSLPKRVAKKAGPGQPPQSPTAAGVASLDADAPAAATAAAEQRPAVAAAVDVAADPEVSQGDASAEAATPIADAGNVAGAERPDERTEIGADAVAKGSSGTAAPSPKVAPADTTPGSALGDKSAGATPPWVSAVAAAVATSTPPASPSPPAVADAPPIVWDGPSLAVGAATATGRKGQKKGGPGTVAEPEQQERPTPLGESPQEGEEETPSGGPSWASRLLKTSAASPSPQAKAKAEAKTPTAASAATGARPAPWAKPKAVGATADTASNGSAAAAAAPSTDGVAPMAPGEQPAPDSEAESAGAKPPASTEPSASESPAEESAELSAVEAVEEAEAEDAQKAPSASGEKEAEESSADEVDAEAVDDRRAEDEGVAQDPSEAVAQNDSVPEEEEEVPPPAEPDASGVIRYSIATLLAIRNSPDVLASPCPETIPAHLRAGSEEADVPKTPDAGKRPRTPKDSAPATGAAIAEEGDDWRAAAAGRQGKGGGRDKESRSGAKGSRGGVGRSSWRQQEDAKLETSENSWANRQQAGKQDTDAVVTRAMKSILNKLTVDKFDTLYQQLLECGIEKGTHIETLVREVFEKATTQHHFIEMYTGLCIKLNDWVTERGLVDDDGAKVNFKRMLLNQCQGSFDSYLKPPAELDELEGDEHFEAKMKYKTKMLGNIKFVGQLLCNQVVSSKIIQRCCLELIHCATEETTETLCVFLSVVGPAFDKKDWKNYHVLADVFQTVKKMCSDTSVPARLRCLLKDVLDLRDAGWVCSRPTNAPEGPKTMGEVKSQWAKDMAAQDRRSSVGGGAGGGGGSSRSFGPPTPSGSQNQGEWEMVPTTSRRGGGASGGGFRGGDGPSGAGRFGGQDRDYGERPAPRPSPLGRSSSEQFPSTPSRGSQQRSTPKNGRDEWRRSPTGDSGLDRPTSTSSAKERPSLLDEGIRLGPSSRLGPNITVMRRPTSLQSPSSLSALAEQAPAPKKSRAELRKEVGSILKALHASHDIGEAVTAVRELRVEGDSQQDILLQIISKGSEASETCRRPTWAFLERLYSEDVLQQSGLRAGMDSFMADTFEDLQCDVPKLPTIVTEEILPAFSAKVGLLTEADISRLRAKALGEEEPRSGGTD